jgi:Zn-dependent protease with chaperone function
MGHRPLIESFQGWLYEAGSARRRQVLVKVDERGVVGLDGIDAAAWPEIGVSARVGAIPRRLTLPDGRVIETADNVCVDKLEDLFRQSRAKGGMHLLESRWKWAGAAVAVTLLAGWLTVQFAVPWAARLIAFTLPQTALEVTGEQTLSMIDHIALGSSRLDSARQKEVEALLQRAKAAAGGGYRFKLALRYGGSLGPNAFALPDGTIVVTDQLVELAANGDQILGVLAHEIGHVQHRHGMQRLVQSSFVAALALFVVGDVSQTVSVLPTMLLENAYSREFEREADSYAVQLMHKMQVPPQALAALLERLQQKQIEDKVPGWLSTHPPTPERIELIERPKQR